ncbi:phage tail tape measure protein [Spirosoma areae]
MGTQNERAVIDLVINGKQSEVTMKTLTAATINQRKALYSLSETDPGYKRQKAELESLMRAQQQRIVRIHEEKTAWEKFKSLGSGVMAGVIGGNVVTAGLQTLLSLPVKLKDAYQSFNSASADMSANLGLAAKDVAYFNKQAEAMGPALGKSAAEMLEGFKLVGSANSDLIKTPELLADVTRQAVTLSQASKMTLADATASLVGSMNQFDAGAEQSTRFINVMAGGAQVGSAEIGDMAMALKASGIVAHQAGLSFEVTNGALQSLSKESLKGEQAGTMFRNILLDLQKGADDTNPRVVGLEKALENLAKKNLSSAEATKLFGKENVTAALSLINHRDRVAEFTKGLTGTSAAYDMAAKNNATLEHQTEMFWAKVDGLAVSLGTKLAPAFTQVVKVGTDLLTALPQLGGWLSKNATYFYAVGLAVVAYSGATIKATISTIANTAAELARKAAYELGFRMLVVTEVATKAYALATGVLTGQISLQTAAVTLARGAWAALSAIMLANPIGVVVAGLSALAFAVKTYSDNTEQALRLEREKLRLQRDLQKLTEKHTQLLEGFTRQLQDYNAMNQQERAEYVKNIAVRRYEIESNLALLKAKEKHLEMLALEPSLWQKLWAVIKSGGNAAAIPTALVEQGVQNAMAIREQYAAGISQAESDLKNYDNLLRQVMSHESPTATITGGGGGLSEEQKKAAKKRQTDAKHDADELEKMLADARQDALKAEQSDYDKAVFAFAEKYTKMYELAKNNTEKIKEIERLSLLEMAAIQQAADEKEDERRRKQAENDNKVGLDAAMNAADQQRTDEMGGIERSQAAAPTAIGDAEVQQLKLQADEAYLTQKLLLEQTFAQESADTQRQLTENWNEQVKLRATTEHAYAEQMKQAEYALQDAKRSAMSEGINVLKGFLKQGSTAYKLAIAGQKAFAIAQVIVDMNREIAQIYANPTWSLLPDGGLTLKTTNATAAKVRAGISIASIAAQGIGELAQKADGGFTGMRELYGGNPSGFTSGPTLYNQGGRSYVAGEAGREWIMSSPMLQNPVMANLAGALQALQASGGWRNLSFQNQPGAASANQAGSVGSGLSDQILVQIYQQLQANNVKMEAIAQRPVNYNYFKVREQRDYVDEINEDTSL